MKIGIRISELTIVATLCSKYLGNCIIDGGNNNKVNRQLGVHGVVILGKVFLFSCTNCCSKEFQVGFCGVNLH